MQLIKTIIAASEAAFKETNEPDEVVILAPEEEPELALTEDKENGGYVLLGAN